MGIFLRTNYTLFCGAVKLQSPPYILEGIEATQNKFYQRQIQLYAILEILSHGYGPQNLLFLNILTSS